MTPSRSRRRSTRARRAVAAIAAAWLAITVASPRRAQAWGVRGHRLVNRVAVQALPADGPTFLLAQVDWIGERASMPDTWRGTSEPFLKLDEDPNHGWFREQFAFLPAIPRSRWEFVLALHEEHLRIRATEPERAALTNVRWTGTLPYAAVETYERIKSAMRLRRAFAAEGRGDLRFIDQDIAFQVGWLGHYVGDGGQPLHATIHADGWVGPNPKGYTRDRAIHGRFETRYVDLLGVEERDLTPRLTPARALADPFTDMLAYLDTSAVYVEEVYQLDAAGAFADPRHARARELTHASLARAAAMLRDLVYTAWLESARAEAPLAGAASPLSRENPRYNPATGSAPAHRVPRDSARP